MYTYELNEFLRKTLLVGNPVYEWFNLVDCLNKAGCVEQAIQLFESLESRYRITPSASLYSYMIYICKNLGDPNRAFKYLNACQKYLVQSHFVSMNTIVMYSSLQPLS